MLSYKDIIYKSVLQTLRMICAKNIVMFGSYIYFTV